MAFFLLKCTPAKIANSVFKEQAACFLAAWSPSLIFFARRGFAFFIIGILLFGAAFSAGAVTSTKIKKHGKSRIHEDAIIDVPMPDEGYLLAADDPFLFDIDYLFPDGKQYSLKLARAWSSETIDLVYRNGDFYIPEALADADYFFRDNHNEAVRECDPRLMDLLHTLLVRVGKPDGEIIILSGYRTQETNDMLRASHRTNAAEFSQHLYGRAIDIRIPGVSAARMKNAALSLAAGGVGYYPRGQFLHVDLGPVRHWTYLPHRGRKHARSKKTSSTKAHPHSAAK